MTEILNRNFIFMFYIKFHVLNFDLKLSYLQEFSISIILCSISLINSFISFLIVQHNKRKRLQVNLYFVV